MSTLGHRWKYLIGGTGPRNRPCRRLGRGILCGQPSVALGGSGGEHADVEGRARRTSSVWSGWRCRRRCTGGVRRQGVGVVGLREVPSRPSGPPVLWVHQVPQRVQRRRYVVLLWPATRRFPRLARRDVEAGPAARSTAPFRALGRVSPSPWTAIESPRRVRRLDLVRRRSHDTSVAVSAGVAGAGVRMVTELTPDYESQWAAIRAVAQKLGIGSARRSASGCGRPRSTPVSAPARRARNRLS